MATVIKLKRGTSTPSTSDIANGEVAIDTSAQKFYINDGGSIKEIGGSGSLNAFKTINLNDSTDIVADSSTDTLHLDSSGLISISANASTDTITLGTPTSIPFTKADGSTSNLETNVSAGTLSTAVSNLFVPFVKADGSSVTTLALSSD